MSWLAFVTKPTFLELMQIAINFLEECYGEAEVTASIYINDHLFRHTRMPFGHISRVIIIRRPAVRVKSTNCLSHFFSALLVLEAVKQ